MAELLVVSLVDTLGELKVVQMVDLMVEMLAWLLAGQMAARRVDTLAVQWVV